MSRQGRSAPSVAPAREQAPAAPSGDASRTVRVPWSASSVSLVRRTLVQDLRERGIATVTVDESEIVVSELVSNAIRHARPLSDGNLRIHWKVKAGVVEVEVTDGGGDSTPRPAPRTIWAPSGRGLRIVRSLAHEAACIGGRGLLPSGSCFSNIRELP